MNQSVSHKKSGRVCKVFVNRMNEYRTCLVLRKMVSFIKNFILDWIPMLSISLASCEVKEYMESV